MYTLWIEKLTDESHGLLEMIGDAEKGIALSDHIIQKIDLKFAVRSFNEFLQKFSPTLYADIDLTNGNFAFSRTREVKTPGDRVEKIHLFTEGGNFQRIDRWIEDLHQGRMLALTQEEKLDWFYYDMMDGNDRFVRERSRLIEKGAGQEAWNEYFARYDQGFFLLRRFVWLAEGIISSNAVFPPLSDRKDGQLQLLVAAVPISLRRKSQEITGLENKMKACLQNSSLKHKELLYWNCIMDLEPDRLSRDAVFVKRQREISDFYQKGMKAFWEAAAPLLHSMFEIKRFLADSGNCLLIGNCDVMELNPNLSYISRFLETVNTKNDKTYQTRQVCINGLHKNTEKKRLARVRFQGRDEEKKFEEDRLEEALNFCEAMHKMKVGTKLQYVEDQMEDIYEFLSKNGFGTVVK